MYEKRLLPAASCCPEPGGSLSYLGEDTTEHLGLMCSAFRVIRTVREKHACTKCDAIVLATAPSRPHLAGFCGVLPVDEYAGVNELYRNGRKTEVTCWAHARRKNHDVHIHTPSVLMEEALT